MKRVPSFVYIASSIRFATTEA
jgi:hypothetical protein